MPATRTSSITSLRYSLDYGDENLSRCGAFKDDVAVFHKRFLGSHPKIDKKRLVWGRDEDRAILLQICDAFLEVRGGLYWPDKACFTNYNRLQYSRNHKQIKELLEQLFFRIHNQHCYYKKCKQKQKNSANQAQTQGLRSPGKRTNTPSSTIQPPLTGRPTAQKSIQGIQRQAIFNNQASRQISIPTVPLIQSQTVLAKDLSVERKCEFIFHLVFSHKPVYSARGWIPNLEFGNINLHELVAELALRQKDFDMHSQLVGFLFTVEGPGLDYVTEVRSNEIIFKHYQQRILKVIKGQLRGSLTTGPLVYEVDIEPIRSENTEEN